MFGFEALLWWHWPEQHGFFTNHFHLFLSSIYLGADIIYPFVLYRVMQTEVILPDGRHISAEHYRIEQALAMAATAGVGQVKGAPPATGFVVDRKGQ